MESIESRNHGISFSPLAPSPNLHKFICFLFSIPCSNAYVESVFSIMKHLYDDKRNHMSTELIRAELQIRLNSSLRCREAYEYFLSKPELLKLVQSSEKYLLKNNLLINSEIYNLSLLICLFYYIWNFDVVFLLLH